MEDLDDLLRNGMTDLFEYGQEFMVGNALGDGSAKKDDNSTDTKKTETFQEKYRRELKKDLDEIDKDDEEEDVTIEEEVTESTEGGDDVLDLDDLIKTEEEAEEEAAAAAEGEKKDL